MPKRKTRPPAPPSERCKIAGCTGKIMAKGLCNMHYMREYRQDDEHRRKAVQYARDYRARKAAEREAEAKRRKA